MVYALIIHTLLPGECQILYSTVYSTESQILGGKQGETDTNVDDGDVCSGACRERRKEWVLSVAEEVQSEYTTRTKLSNRSYEQELLTLQNEGTLPEFELGFFRIPASGKDIPGQGTQTPAFPPISEEDKIVVWLGALNIGFTLVCEKLENRVMAESVLKLMIKYLHDHLRILNQPSEALQKPDRVAMVTRQLLPAGRLLPMNHRFIRQIEKELEANMKL